MKISKDFVVREIAGDFVAVPVGGSVADFNKLVTLNETGAFLWKALSEDKTEKELTDLLSYEYEVSGEDAKTDVKDFINLLKNFGVLEDGDSVK